MPKRVIVALLVATISLLAFGGVAQAGVRSFNVPKNPGTKYVRVAWYYEDAGNVWLTDYVIFTAYGSPKSPAQNHVTAEIKQGSAGVANGYFGPNKVIYTAVPRTWSPKLCYVWQGNMWMNCIYQPSNGGNYQADTRPMF